MKEVFLNIYNGILRHTPLKKYVKFVTNRRGFFPAVGILDDTRKAELEKILGIQVKSIEYFEQAMLHRSYLPIIQNDNLLSNERLEFLGDAVLGMIVADYLFSMHSGVLEGELTKMRSWLVNRKSLAFCARKIGIEPFIMMSYSAARSLEKGSDSILSDALEALIGAIYLDSGLEVTRKFITHTMLPILITNSVMVDRNYKSLLLETIQASGKQSPSYEVVEESGPDHDKEFLVGCYIEGKLYGTGTGKSKKEAEQSAAMKTLQFFNDKNLQENIH
jgi:ribonuclease III